MVAEGRSRVGGGEVVKGRRDASRRRRLSGGASVRRRVRAVDAIALAPPTPPLQRLLAACRRAFGGPGTVPVPGDIAVIRGILDKMRPEDVHLSAVTKAAAASVVRRRRPIITRTTIYECTNFSVVVFLLPPGAVIPLHDHPGMTVFSKLLLGSLHVTSYDWATGGADDSPPPTSGGAPPPRLARLVLDADLRAPCGALVLFPESGGNMHRFAASTACAVLDVLGPPYSGDRDCTYYQDLPYSQSQSQSQSQQPNREAAGDDDAARAADDDEHRRRGWLVETGKPEELEMYEVPYYKGLQAAEDNRDRSRNRSDDDAAT